MKNLSIEFKKSKRSGVIPIMLSIGVFGAIYVIANFVIRKDSLLSLPLAPMDILLTQLYGVLAVLNLFGIIAAACLIYQIEFTGNAMKKMYMLPLEITGLYACKTLILGVMLLIFYIIQYSALGIVGNLYLPEHSFEFTALLWYALYTFVTALPVLLFMILISSRVSNIWVTLGIGVVGFFSGMATVLADSIWPLINPFALIIYPATATSATVESKILMIALVETIVFFIAGVIVTKKMHYE